MAHIKLLVKPFVKSLLKPAAYSLVIFFFLFIFSPDTSSAATLSVTPATGTFETGQTFPVKVLVTSNNVPYNAVSGLLTFPTDIFSIESVSKSNSVLNFWVTEPFIAKGPGTVKFEGIALGGATSSTGTVVTINLRAIKAGSGKVGFQSGQILANDGEGTDITGNLIGASYTVVQATPKPEPVPTPAPAPEPAPIPEAPQPKPTLHAPEIMLGTKYGAQAIIGTSDYPKAQVLVTFVAIDGVKIFIQGAADQEGEFTLVVPNSLKRGNYTVSAVVIKEDKTNSDTSNIITVAVGSLISDIPLEAWIFMGLLLLAILYLILRIYFHLRKDKNKDKDRDQKDQNNQAKTKNIFIPVVDKEKLHQAEDVLHKSMKALRDDVTDRARGVVNSVERTNIEELKKDIDSTEKVIEKEIKNIE